MATEVLPPSTAAQRITYEEIVQRAGAPVVALVLGVANFHGVAIIRGLGKMGVPVYALGEPDSLGFYSRYTRAKWVCANPHRVEILLPALEEIARKLQGEGRRAVLFPTSDTDVKILSANRDKLPSCFIVHVPDLEVINQCADKQTQCRAAQQLGVPLPRTYEEGETARLRADLAAGRLAFPILFKARVELVGQLRKDFRFIEINGEPQLNEIVDRAGRSQIRFLIQEIIPGGDDTLYTFGSCRSRTGGLTAVFTGRKLRQRPPRFGEARVSESRDVAEIIQSGEKLLRGLKFFGISQVEFKFDARDGQYKLIEINPRAWSWIGLPVAMGINIPYAFFCDAVGVSFPPCQMGNRRALWISLYYDLYWSLKERDGTPWKHCFQPYDQKVESYLSASDLKPSLIHLQRMTFEFAGMLWRQLARKFRAAPGSPPRSNSA